MAPVGNALLTALVVIDGKVVGMWKRTLRKNSVEVRIQLFRPLAKDEKALLTTEVSRYGTFLGIKEAKLLL